MGRYDGFADWVRALITIFFLVLVLISSRLSFSPDSRNGIPSDAESLQGEQTGHR